MPLLAIVVWIANVVADTASRVAFKFAASQGRKGMLWFGILCGALEFVLWLALVSLIPLSQAILMASVNIVTVAIAGKVIFGEELHRARATGITLIAIGVALAGGAA
jgi:drug/metabolite transporter (DMT)-like permease